MSSRRIRTDARCETPGDPRWAKVFEPPPPPEVPELDFERTSGVHPVERPGLAKVPLARVELVKRRAGVR